MTTPDVLLPLRQFLQLSQQLLALANTEEWVEFELLLKKREEGLAALGDNHLLIAVTKAGLAEDMRGLLGDIQQVNDQIGMVAERNKADLAVQLRKAFQAEKAIDAYQK
jgi:hypothetical protein